MKYIFGLILILGIMGDSCEPDNYRGTKTIAGRVIEKYQVVPILFKRQCQLSGAHALINTSTERYDITGNPAAQTIVGDSIVTTVKNYRECDSDNWFITELHIIK